MFCFFYSYGDTLYQHLLPPSFPPRRFSELLACAAEIFERRVLSVDERDDDIAFARGARLLDQRIVAVEDSRLDHRIARHFERIMITRDEQRRGDGEIVMTLQRPDRPAPSGIAVQRTPHTSVPRQRAHTRP